MCSESRANQFESPEAYLERLQRACPGRPVPDAREMERRWRIPDALAQGTPEGLPSPTSEDSVRVYSQALESAQATVPTEQQDACEYMLLKSVVDDIRCAMERAGLSASEEKVVFGTLNTGDPNALVISCPGGGYVIAVNAGLMTLLYLISKAVGLAIETTVSSDGEISFSVPRQMEAGSKGEHGNALERFAEAIYCCAKLGDARRARRWFPTQSALVWGGLLTQAAERFIVSHEFGHVLQGHLASALTAERHVGSETVTTMSYSWEQEGEADIVALGLTLGTRLILPGFSAHFMGIALLFKALEFYLRGLGLPTHSASHPAPEWRLESLLLGAGSTIGSPVERAIRDATALASLLDSMWRLTQDTVGRRAC